MKPFVIRTLRQDDADCLLQFELANRAWFERTVDPRGDAFYSAEGVRAHIAHYLHAHADGTHDPCLIVDDDGAIIGRANLKDIDAQAGCAEVGYRLALQQAGQGLATQAVRHLITLAQTRWQLQRLLAYVTVDNAASARVLEKSGFLRSAPIAQLTTIQGQPLAGHLFILPIAPAI